MNALSLERARSRPPHVLVRLESRFNRLAANLTAPILDGARAGRKVELACGQVDEAVANYRSIILTAFREAEDGLGAGG